MSRPKALDGIAEIHLGCDYTDEEREFLVALERYRQSRHRRFPSCREILQVIKSLGYRKPATSIDSTN
jgi:hypothetical protein